MRYHNIECLNLSTWLAPVILGSVGIVAAADSGGDWMKLEQQFRTLPMESREWCGPLFWLHGDESREKLEMYVGKMAEGGNGCFTAESRPHVDWLGEGWWRDLGICLEAARKNDVKMWIFDEKWFPSQIVGGKVPERYAAKRLAADSADVEGPKSWVSDGYSGPQYVAAVAGKLTADNRIESESLVDLSPFIAGGKLTWQVPAGRWKIIRFTYAVAPPSNDGYTLDGASKDSVDWFIATVFQPHYDHFGPEFGRAIRGFFYDEPFSFGDWGTELRRVFDDRKVDWKKAMVAYKFELAGNDQTAAKYQYLVGFAETLGRTMYGGMTEWCHRHNVKSIGHFFEHRSLYVNPELCAGDMMILQGYSDMGGIDDVWDQFVIGQRACTDAPCWQTPKMGSSVSHVFNKSDDVAMVEIFAGKTQNFSYRDLKWCTDHMQVSGINFIIPSSFNTREPYDNDWPPYYYNGGFEPRWPLYRVFANYTSRLSVMLTGGRHVSPVAILFSGNPGRVGKLITPEHMSEVLQDSLYDCDWLPMDVFEQKTSLEDKKIKLYGERYSVLVVPPVEVIPYETLVKVREFHEAGGIVIGYGFLPGKSGTIGHTGAEIAALVDSVWGPNPQASATACKTSARGGRSYFLAEQPDAQQIKTTFADARLPATLEVAEGNTNNWLHVLHRQKAGRDIFLVCNQNWDETPRKFRFRITASGEPECWDAMRGEITSLPYKRLSKDQVEVTLTLEPLESILIVFQPNKSDRPARLEPDCQPSETIDVARDPNPPVTPLVPEQKGGPLTLGPDKAADPFNGQCTIPANVDLAKRRIFLEMVALPGEAARVMVNGKPAGGLIGKPHRLDVGEFVRPGKNEIQIVPFAPKAVKLVFFGRESGGEMIQTGADASSKEIPR